MTAQIKVQTSDSFYKNQKKIELGTEVTEEDKEFIICEFHFGKSQVGEFWVFEDVILCYVSGSRYDFIYNEELYEKLKMIHE